MDFQTQKKLYNLCNPKESLAPDDTRNVKLDEKHHVRGLNWAQSLAKKISLASKSGEKPVVYFTGLPGTGKTTELRRLQDILSHGKHANLLTVYIDAERFIDLSNKLHTPDIIAPMIFRAEEEVLKAEGKAPETALQDGYLSRLWNWLNETDVELNKVSVDVGLPTGKANLAVELRNNPNFRAKVNNIIEGHVSSFIANARQHLTLLEDRARQAGKSGLFILFDQLEKLQGSTSNWKDVLESAETVFGQNASHLEMPVPVLYTVPPALYFRIGSEINFMPAVKIQHRDNQDNPMGFKAMRDIAYSRIPADHMQALLGPEHQDQVNSLIRWSGGYVRQFVYMLKEIVQAYDGRPLNNSEILLIRNRLWDDYYMRIYTNEYEWLAKVHIHKKLQPNGHESVQTAERLITKQTVLRFISETEWFGLHPATLNIPGIQAETQRLKQALAQK